MKHFDKHISLKKAVLSTSGLREHPTHALNMFASAAFMSNFYLADIFNEIRFYTDRNTRVCT